MPLPIFETAVLQTICDILGDTVTGLTGSEIGKLFNQLNIQDSPVSTKRHRIFEALDNQQKKDRCGNNVAAFIQATMQPVRYINKTELFNIKRDELNEALSFAGFSLCETGKLNRIEAAFTLNDAQQKANRVQAELRRRQIHCDVLRFCRAELIQNNFFHAVFEATKSVANKLRLKAGLTSDGCELVDQALGLSKIGIPLLAFNTLQTETEKSEHKGLANLFRGLFGAFRNVTAHEPKINWVITEQDALDLFTLSSLLHRRLDEAVTTRPNPISSS